MKVGNNADRLVTQVLAGEVWPPLADRNGYRVDADGRPFLLPGMGGVTLGAHPGDPATGYAADHLEPGLSIRHRDPDANMALQFLSCVGNVVRLADGTEGVVIGQHAYVLADFPEPVPAGVTVGDQVTVLARGQGLRLADHPLLTVKNCSPDLLARMPGGTRADGRLEVHVAARVPAEAMGAGVGMPSEFANTDLMGAYAGLSADLSLGLEGLRVGDFVALEDADHSYGRGHRAGHVTIGVISTGHCLLFGHGPGPSTLISGPAAAFHLVDDPDANLAALYPEGAAI
ncbi:DUF4438 family protein [Spongiactinospora gelatinilytica]|uniref:DUF4438 family protein n=1 Tax=Spongiactinospora gelatinilytica TaxID=2666298 RepID=UPI0018F6CA69|nr:DUF4438 domain-containing protein [Spongiactinospora gelatinilytica]